MKYFVPLWFWKIVFGCYECEKCRKKFPKYIVRRIGWRFSVENHYDELTVSMVPGALLCRDCGMNIRTWNDRQIFKS